MTPAMRKALAIVLLLACGLLAWPPVTAAAQDQPASSQAAAPQSTVMFARPIPMGSSCGNWQSSPFIYTGTCGLRVRFFSAPDITAILSNNHVFGAQGPLLCPNTATPLQTLTLQPGTLDIPGIPADPMPFAVGLFLGFVPIDFAPNASNVVDAAVSLTVPSLADSRIETLGQPVQSIVTPAPGMAVTKTGRTTNSTNGTITSVNTTVTVSYGTDCGNARFVGQIVITPGSFSAGGDSGSAILQTSTKIPVGLLFAGSPFATIANDIRAVYVRTGSFPDGVPPTGAASARMSMDSLRLGLQRSANAEIDRVTAIKARNEEALFRNSDVVGVGVGENENGATAIVVFTRGAAAITAQALPAQVEGVPVRVIHSGAFDAFRW